ncbi:pectate lyase [Mangrovibacter sp. MFB070]|uniref:right-handed parallel beta-helix repeat-containing protein n=1 Tax=Mangrovibacter sp. MFB070 TaxID=1224318 RepID=UPI0004D4E162|nr:right-handed parallel beta-helix repeat-containing protein [Mangrovibacter sp. MFB070]KEA50919.1 pectate lyase [Mangrovibacter sp. MFB070]
MSKLPFALTLCGAVLSAQVCAQQQPHIWHAITFGQSTDVNFSSNVLPEKVGVNDVTIAGKKLDTTSKADLSQPVTIESRGGKIANSHDGLTFFYTQLPADQNFSLQATVTVNQFGPENGAKPAAQEGAGLLVRDILGNPRQNPLKPGYEEFPSASNMVMNAIMTQDRKDADQVKMQAMYRQGVSQPWGNAGAAITKKSYKEQISLAKNGTFRLKLQRTNDGYITSWAPAGSDDWVSQQVKGADSVTVQDKQHYYVGFFASRNAKITISDATLTTTPAETQASPAWVAKPWPVVAQIASSDKSASNDYVVQARANYDGTWSVTQNEVVIGANKTVKAGEMMTQPASLANGNQFSLDFTPANAPDKPVVQKLVVEKIAASSSERIYAGPQGKADNAGTSGAPLDLTSAVHMLPPGGTLVLSPGDYAGITIPLSASGLADKHKTLVAEGKAVIHGVLLEASYWNIKGIDVTDKSLRITGSHNLVENVTAYHNDDTGIQISSPDKIGRPLWASYNRIVNSESWGNEDPGKINADGFAVKMRVGEGNRLEGCYAHNNVDDGFDLFNKIEDGPNGVVVIENSIARNNTSNGFKLGGEGQPVAHQIRNSIAIGNHLDGFTDNFNPGRLVVENNTAVDNQRFNFIFRPSPYGGPETQGVFKGNKSLRTTPAKYDDAVTGDVDKSDYFIHKGKSVNSAGKEIKATDFSSLTMPEPLLRKPNGTFDFGSFLQKK